MTTALPRDFSAWLAGAAEDIDTGAIPADRILPQLAAAGLAAAGVPAAGGGAGGDVTDAIDAVTAVARESLTAAFVLWGHRTYIEFLLQSPNSDLRDELLPDLLAGRIAGASGLSNAMKFLSGLEPLQISAREIADGFVLNGKLPWVTNLRPQGFHVAAAADRADGGPTLILSLAHDDDGVVRSPDLSLMAMRSSDTAAVAITEARIARRRVISDNAAEWLPRVRPAFVGLQCGMSIGLARRALSEAESVSGAGRDVLGPVLADLGQRLARAEQRLFHGLRTAAFVRDAAPLFELRIELAEIVAEAVSLELQAGGGRCYLREPGRAFARRWREAAFIPVITPSLVQLRTALDTARKAA